MPDNELKCGEGLAPCDLDRSKYPAPFLEAHPRISAVQAASELKKSFGRCVWRWPGKGSAFAYADLKMSTSEAMVIHLECPLAGRNRGADKPGCD